MDKFDEILPSKKTVIREPLDSVNFTLNIGGNISLGLFEGYYELKQIGLAGCNISSIDQDSFAVADTLHLDGSERKKLTQLEILNLNNNNMSKIGGKSFHQLAGLKHLSLQNNLLSEITQDMFFGVEEQLETLNLQGNNIKKIPQGFFQNFKSLKNIILTGNPIAEIESIEDCMFLLRLGGNGIDVHFVVEQLNSKLDKDTVSSLSIEDCMFLLLIEDSRKLNNNSIFNRELLISELQSKGFENPYLTMLKLESILTLEERDKLQNSLKDYGTYSEIIEDMLLNDSSTSERKSSVNMLIKNVGFDTLIFDKKEKYDNPNNGIEYFEYKNTDISSKDYLCIMYNPQNDFEQVKPLIKQLRPNTHTHGCNVYFYSEAIDSKTKSKIVNLEFLGDLDPTRYDIDMQKICTNIDKPRNFNSFKGIIINTLQTDKELIERCDSDKVNIVMYHNRTSIPLNIDIINSLKENNQKRKRNTTIDDILNEGSEGKDFIRKIKKGDEPEQHGYNLE